MTNWNQVLQRIDAYHWELPQSYKQGMRVPGIVYASDKLMQMIVNDQSLEQVANVAFLPGIVRASFAMPDIHWGYGFPIGGVAATRVEDGVVSPGGVGYDINCGVRMLRTDLTAAEVRPRIRDLVNELFQNIPSGVGKGGKLRLRGNEIEQVLVSGAHWAVEHGLGDPEDLQLTEEGGAITDANPDKVSKRAKERGTPQLGTLGSGNHFLEVQTVEEIFDTKAARTLGIEQAGQVTLMFHCGSRGLGHQVCDDYLEVVEDAVKKYEISVPDKQLACAPVMSQEGQNYLQAMRCGANFAWANRQIIAHWARETFAKVFGRTWRDLGMHQIYDVAHNIAKIEEHQIDGQRTRLCVHRKGATRAFPAGSPDLPEKYGTLGQPILIPGDMGRYSYLLIAGEHALEHAFGTTCHGAGREQSRGAAKRSLKGVNVAKLLEDQGIIVRATSMHELAEEASIAYKDVANVVDVTHKVGISHKVARMRPLGVVKG